MNVREKNSSSKYLATERAQAWEVFKSFSSEKRKKGKTLASSLEIKLRGTLVLSLKRASHIRRAFRPGESVAAISLLVPPEICWASGFLPFNWEMFASFIAPHPRITELTNRGSEQTPRCSFLNALKGAFLEGLLPPPDVVVSSSGYCEGAVYLFEDLARGFEVDQLHLDIPSYYDNSAVAWQAEQLQNVFSNLCHLNGINREEGEEKLREVMYYSTLAKQVYLDIVQLRREHPHLDLSLEPLIWHFGFLSLWGTPEGHHMCESLKKDIIAEIREQGNEDKAAKSEGIPIAIFSQFPYGPTEMWQRMRQAGAYTVYEGVNCLDNITLPDSSRIHDMSITDLFHCLARNLVSTPMRGGDIREQAKKYMEITRTCGTKGFIIFSHDQCQLLGPRLEVVEEAAVEIGLEVCVISGDCITGIPLGPASLRLESFLSSLSQKQTPLPAAAGLPLAKKSLSPYYRIGIDFGSGFSKFVVVNSEANIIKKGIFNSGIDYPSLLRKIMGEVPTDRSYELVIAGIGGNNPRFKGLAKVQTTEINALINAVRNLFNNRQPLLVVDIGSQDIKVLKFSGKAEPPWCNTNSSCGAGTGTVLSQILERWQQTKPDMTFKKLDELAYQAQRAENINTTCGIFAVTNVVSALISSDEKRRKEILRGAYQYITSQATRLFPPGDRTGTLLLPVGGLANHKTLRRAFEEEGFRVSPPSNPIHPQYLVAFGAALSLNTA